MSISPLAQKIEKRTEQLEAKYGIWMTRKQIETDMLKMGEGKFPVEKLNVFDVCPSGRRPRYTTASVAAYLVACEVPASIVLDRYKKP